MEQMKNTLDIFDGDIEYRIQLTIMRTVNLELFKMTTSPIKGSIGINVHTDFYQIRNNLEHLHME